ncbi:MAG: glycosyltransferase family 2 protein [Flavobacteriales bacterium]|nr:glycosyltransferase family 2 protein [Flavobacteriales bacterium]
MSARVTDLRRVRVVIPCRNEAGYITRCLQSLVDCDREGLEVEVRVCDGLSDDGTRDEVGAFTARLPWITMVDNPQRTTPHAMNAGLRPDGYDVGFILGAHAEVDRGFIRSSVDELRRHPEAGCAGGIIENVYHDAVSRRIGLAMGHPFGVGSAHFRTGLKEGEVDTVAFGAYRREVFDRIGYFDERLARNQDDELNYRVVKAGFRIRLNSAIRSRYHVRGTYGKLWRQYRQYGFWKVLVNRIHGAVTTTRQLVPALLVLAFVPGAMLALLVPLLRLPWITGACLYVTVALISAMQAARGLRDAPGVLLAFFTLHFAYGIGYLHGLWHFMLLRRGTGSDHEQLTR